ncbi:hypothetical protein BHE74_00034407 [Ensete ventricosum]|nr:hypothetical protein GW17_00029895 [Ensete ventricosum]RWW58698.1 hypothetical protein BHE74_00034407 [Ensete ventricosum]RZS11556.1 hypothetical protein BHM03_00042896 [Ensete ventricosum]
MQRYDQERYWKLHFGEENDDKKGYGFKEYHKESSIPYSYGGGALVMKGAEEVENAEANSKYQDKAEG